MNPHAHAMRHRAEALRFFNRWQERHPAVMEPGVAIEAIGWIWQLLPVASRLRAVDPRGVQRMQTMLAVLR